MRQIWSGAIRLLTAGWTRARFPVWRQGRDLAGVTAVWHNTMCRGVYLKKKFVKANQNLSKNNFPTEESQRVVVFVLLLMCRDLIKLLLAVTRLAVTSCASSLSSSAAFATTCLLKTENPFIGASPDRWAVLWRVESWIVSERVGRHPSVYPSTSSHRAHHQPEGAAGSRLNHSDGRALTSVLQFFLSAAGHFAWSTPAA